MNENWMKIHVNYIFFIGYIMHPNNYVNIVRDD